jgi:MFS transporter, YNFM family, putative membrane transport protein
MIELHSLQYKRVALSLALGSFLVFCNLYLFQPILPTLAEHYSVSETQSNWIFAASTITLALTLVPWAIISERIGRRAILLMGLSALPLVALVMLLVDSWYTLIAARALTGLSIAAFAAVAVAYMVEELSPSAFNSAIGTYIAASSLGGITGRIIGGIVTDSLGWKSAVLLMCILTSFGVLAVFLMLPKQEHFQSSQLHWRNHISSVAQHMRNHIISVAMLIGAVNFALFVNLYSVMGFRLVSAPHSIPVGLASLIFLCYLGGTLSSKLTSTWLKRYHPILGMTIGAFISMLGMWLAAIDKLPTILGGLALISFGAFFTHTLAYSWVSQHAHHSKATATALYLVHYYIGGSIGGFFLLYCWQHGRWDYVLVGGMVLFALLFFLCWKLKSTMKMSEQKSLVAN